MREPSCRAMALSISALSTWVAGCHGAQSALQPAGRAAEQIADLFWTMTLGSIIAWLAFVALAVAATFRTRGALSARQGNLLIVGGGVAVPVVVLSALLFHGLSMMPDLLAAAPADALHVEVTGHQWWWRVRYVLEDGRRLELANEIHLPVGRAVEFHLETRDVIHSFWIPSLAGKMDMIPGRRTRLLVEPTSTGLYRGACAEYCGASHALMALFVVVEEPQQFEHWLAGQALAARAPEGARARRGARVLQSTGCGACHTIRGTAADGVIGPDLTHVGSRHSIGAATLPGGAMALRRWIADTQKIKPAVHMPSFGMLPDEELDALAAYLEELK